MVKILWFVVCLTLTSFAQGFTVGALGGVRATELYSGNLSDESKRYVAGLSLELHLPLRLSVEADALYQHLGYSYTLIVPILPFGLSQVRERNNSWEFPLLLKYHPPAGPIHPFAGIGIAPRIVTLRDDDSGYTIDPRLQTVQLYSSVYRSSYDPTVGLVLAGGVEFRVSRLGIAPQVRYTWWNQRFLDETVRNYGFLGLEFYRANQQQLEVMVGIGWRIR